MITPFNRWYPALKRYQLATICVSLFAALVISPAPALAAGTPTGRLIASVTGEHLERRRVVDEFVRVFASENFQELEDIYQKAVKEGERLPSGVFRSSTVLLDVDYAFGLYGVPLEVKDQNWTKREAAAERWAKAFPQSSAAAVFHSEFLIRHAFVFRGGGYASSVTPEGKERFAGLVEKAYQVLAAQAVSGRQDPEWHRQMITVARLQGGRPAERYADVLKNALAAFPYFYGIYFEAATFLVPQWGGSAQAVEAFARKAADATKDREGQALYARIYWSVSHMFNGDPVRNGTAEWPRLRSGFDDIVKRYPDPWNLNTYARYACQAGDAKTLNRVFALIGSNIDEVAWQGDTDMLKACRAMAK